MQRTCTKCEEAKKLEEFPLYNAERGWRRHECHTCVKRRMTSFYKGTQPEMLKRARERYQANPAAIWSPERKTRAYQLAKDRSAKYRDEVFSLYGVECVACGEKESKFLTLDHINNDGWERRKSNYREGGIAFYLDIIRHGKRDDLEVLCFNCNFGKARNGGILIKDRRVNGRCNDQSESS